jgi:hypothetical protein
MNRRKPPAGKTGRIARVLWLALLAGAALAPSAVVSAGSGERFFPFNAPADPLAPRISGLDVVQVAQLAPGAQLRFELRGTPGAQASLRIDGARRVLGLAEVATADRIGPDATVVGNLRRGEQLGMAMLTGPLQRDAARPRAPA